MKHTIKNKMLAAAVLAAAVLFLLRAPDAAAGAADALRLCGTAVIPSMLPFLVITAYMQNAGVLSGSGRASAWFCRHVFRQPAAALYIWSMSMIGGFPIGAKMTASALRGGELTENQARRLAAFCIGGGPAFIVNTVGGCFLGSRKAGWILLSACCLAQFAAGFLTRFFAKQEPAPRPIPKLQNRSGALTRSVGEAGGILLSVCCWVLVFGALSRIVAGSALPQEAKLWLTMVLEVTNGCAAAAKRFPVPILAFLLSFGGFSVHAQILPFLEEIGLPYRRFFAVRVCGASLAAVITAGLLRVFPCETQTFAGAVEAIPRASAVSPPASVCFLLMFALMILELAARAKVWYDIKE